MSSPRYLAPIFSLCESPIPVIYDVKQIESYSERWPIEQPFKMFSLTFETVLCRGGLAGRAIRADARREKVRESIDTFAFLSILPTDLHFPEFVGWLGQIVPGTKNIASPPLVLCPIC